MKRAVVFLVGAAAIAVAFTRTLPDPFAGRTVAPMLQLFTGTPLSAAYLPRIWKSINPVNIAWTGSANGTATISATTANALPIFTGATTTQPVWTGSPSLISVSSNMTLTVGNGGAGGGTYSGVWTGVVLELPAAFVKSQGCSSVPITTAATSGTATIASVTKANTLLAYEGFDLNAGGSNATIVSNPEVTLTNGTTVTAALNTATSTGVTMNVRFCWLELR